MSALRYSENRSTEHRLKKAADDIYICKHASDALYEKNCGNENVKIKITHAKFSLDHHYLTTNNLIYPLTFYDNYYCYDQLEKVVIQCINTEQFTIR